MIEGASRTGGQGEGHDDEERRRRGDGDEVEVDGDDEVDVDFPDAANAACFFRVFCFISASKRLA